MNSYGFPNTDIYQEQGGEESFWPSFTDIMMVIVMTFLLIAVAVILNNWQLMNNLRVSMEAEQQASSEAQSALQVLQNKKRENETLEQRLARLEAFIAKQTAELESSREQYQTVQTELTQTNAQLQNQRQQVSDVTQRLNAVTSSMKTTTQQLTDQQTELDSVKQQLHTKESEFQASSVSIAKLSKEKMETAEQLAEHEKTIQRLREKEQDGHEQLASLQGEFDELDTKYQKLLRPARSEKNKQVVKVEFSQVSGRKTYRLQEPGKKAFKAFTKSQLKQRLNALKKQYKADLYVKIVFPKNSGLSQDDAWKFTSEMLNAYDYYYDDE
ncbi:MAG: Unknown protein [uncultured Thiotrichaceae bacterium]|uniref:Chromosome partition protein Smc n=1 Tax=uncultured Thiotrichaceae bacterium TaxID=298394 RepID=A0A6S6UDT5_9GAMM|nr:MAG: Unknown protein [uncultured Thiotrichaceae bacterium]